MGYLDCPCCGGSRKVGARVSLDGEYVEKCPRCADPEYLIPND